MIKYVISAIAVIVLVGFAIIYFHKGPPLTPNKTSKTNENTINTNKQSDQSNISTGENPKIPFILPQGYVVHVFASSLGSARDLQFTPSGTLLVSDPKSGEVIALPDKDNNGVADIKKKILSGKNRPHGISFYDGKLYVAEVDKVVKYNWDESKLVATLDKTLFSLPSNGNHNNRSITFDNTGKMYISVGSTCDVCIEESNLSAKVLISDKDGKEPKVFASGLRNAPFITINSNSQELWGTEMGRDNLGDNIPPDEINIIKEGKNYGWPNCFGDKIHDTLFDNRQSNPCNSTETPTYQIPAHSAPLGLTFISSTQFPEDWQGDLLVAYHGSWNSSVPTGYKVVRLITKENKVVKAEDFLTGFLPKSAKNGPSSAYGRPVDLTFDTSGNLYLSDDKAGSVYIIQKNN